MEEEKKEKKKFVKMKIKKTTTVHSAFGTHFQIYTKAYTLLCSHNIFILDNVLRIELSFKRHLPFYLFAFFIFCSVCGKVLFYRTNKPTHVHNWLSYIRISIQYEMIQTQSQLDNLIRMGAVPLYYNRVWWFCHHIEIRQKNNNANQTKTNRIESMRRREKWREKYTEDRKVQRKKEKNKENKKNTSMRWSNNTTANIARQFGSFGFSWLLLWFYYTIIYHLLVHKT